MLAIKFAHEKNLHNVWLETDSTTVVKPFNPLYSVPWLIRNKWINCINLVSQWNFIVSHTFREMNSCADALANAELTWTDTTHYTCIPLFIRVDFCKEWVWFAFL